MSETGTNEQNRTGGRPRWNRMVDRFGTLLLALLLALIIWLIATNQENPIIQQAYSERLAVSVRGLTGSVEPVQDLSGVRVNIMVRAPARSWETLDASDFTAYIDLTGLEPGEHDVPVTATVVDPQVEIIGTQPSRLRVQLDEVIAKDLVIEATITGAPAENYVALAPIAEPLTVTVSGPATLVNQITRAQTNIRLLDAKSQVVAEAVPVALIDAQGETVAQVDSEPAFVKVVVPIEQQAGRKEVAVRPNLDGNPAAGYRLGSVRVTPSTVVLEGDSEVLDQVPGFVETLELSLGGATASIDQRIGLVLPDGVTVREGNTVVIAAVVTPIESGATLEQKPIIQGLNPGLEARVALDAVEVILRGPQPLLESMEPDDMFVILDLAELLPGSHAVKPRVILPDGISQEGVFPETVEVVITAAQTVSPNTLQESGTITGTVTPAAEAATPSP